MRYFFAIVLLVTFVFQNTSQFWILASFYAQREYIAENLCVNRFDKIPVCKGQCYLNKQLNENTKKEQQLPELKHSEIQLFIHTENILISNSEILLLDFKAFCILSNIKLSDFKYSVFHPPQLG